MVGIALEVASWKDEKRVYSPDHINNVTVPYYDSLELIKPK